MASSTQILIIAVLVGVTCAIPGVFLMLRRMSMMGETIAQSVLFGIVLAFFITQDLNSPWLVIGAASTGVLTVWLVEILGKTRLLGEDAAMGLVFPLLFSIAIILISRQVGRVHLHTETVLLGELTFAPFDRLILFGHDFGARLIYTTGAMLVLNGLFVWLFFKELKIVSFDPIAAKVLGISVPIIHYVLMTLVSMTTVISFEAVGAVLVTAFLIGPAASAYLLTKDLKKMILLAAIFAAASGFIGFHVAFALDVSIAGTMASVVGVIFFLIFVFSPREGLLVNVYKKSKQRKSFAEIALLFHLNKHPEKDINGMQWSDGKLTKTIRRLVRSGRLQKKGSDFVITDEGRALIRELEIEIGIGGS